MRRLVLILTLCPLTALAEDGVFPLPLGAWTCQTPQGLPAFALTIGDEGTYRDPAGAEGTFQQPGAGMIALETGPWAGTVGSHILGGPMALMFPDSKVPVICLPPPA